MALIYLREELERFSRTYRLTPREYDVLFLLVTGFGTVPEIAEHLSLSGNTVHNHFKNIFRRTRTNTKAALLSLFLQQTAERNTVSGLFQDTFQFSVTGLSIVAVSITNSEINSSGESFGGILGSSGFIDLAVGADIPLTYSTTPVPRPDGSTIHVQHLEGNGLVPIGTYTVVVEGAMLTAPT